MSLTTALFTGLSGLDVHTRSLAVIGDNITNINTIGFKGSRAEFESQLSNTLSAGSGPRGDSGGTNPAQIGLGVRFAGTQRNHNNGSIQPTGVNTDLALEGNGFFILNQDGRTLYSRNGSFGLDASNQLVNSAGGKVQGFGVDDDFNIVPGALRDLQVPIGSLTVAEATRNVDFAGNLNAAGPVADAGPLIATQAMTDLDSGAPATAATLLDRLSSDGATPLFTAGDPGTAGDVVTLDGAEKGGRSLGPFTFEVNADNVSGSDAAGATFGDFTAFLESVLGLHTDADAAGVTVDADTGALRIAGNFGEVNDLSISGSDITSTGGEPQPFTFTKEQAANGESTRTTFQAHDSLGTPVTVDLSMVLAEKDGGGTMWRYYAESADDTDLDLALNTGTLSFDNSGALSAGGAADIQLNRAGTGASDPMEIALNFSGGGQAVTALSDTGSDLAAVFQDGSPKGTLDSFAIGADGTINGSFTNGLSRTLGQVALATFSNPQGLLDAGGNMYETGPNSGRAVEVAPLAFGTGRIVSGALELSNVDLSEEFVNLISTSTGFSASSRVITTSDELIQQLLAIAR